MWPVQRRKFPSDDIAVKLQGLVLHALNDYARRLHEEKPPKDLKHILATIATGNMKRQPFPSDLIGNLRMDLCSALKNSGFGDGLPQQGDFVQKFHVHLIDGLLQDFRDPDFYFCRWWANGVWLG